MTGSPSAMYTSSNIQNQNIKVLSDPVTQKIISKVIAATWFTVIADEVTDVSNKEQLSLVLRYVDPDTLLIREDLVGFFECDTGITGRQLSDKMIAYLEAYGVDLSNLRGQSYDRAGNMAGSVNGTAALMTQRFPLVLYLHCASHCLNLAVVRSLEITQCSQHDGCGWKDLPIFCCSSQATESSRESHIGHPTSLNRSQVEGYVPNQVGPMNRCHTNLSISPPVHFSMYGSHLHCRPRVMESRFSD